jgi:hypothetical protein
MTDQWVPSAPLTPLDEWGATCGCAPGGGPASADNVIITGSPGAITSVPAGLPLWSIVLNDGTPAADFRIDRYYANPGPNTYSDPATLFDSPLTISRATGVVSFHAPVMLEADPVQPLEAATKAYVDSVAGGLPDAPNDGTLYGRQSAAWTAAYPATNPANYQTAAQVTAALAGYLPLTGGNILGSLSVTSVLTVLGSNSMVLNALIAGQQRAILAQTNGANRWQMILADGTAESGSDSGSNFILYPISDTNSMKPAALAFNRATGLGTIAGDPTAALGIATKQYVDAHAGGGGISDAPNDGTAYARKSAAWSHLTHTDITDWTATLAPYALTAAVPPASTTTPLPNGTAAVGTSTAYARADHVHPSAAATAYSNANRIINGDMRIDQRGVASGAGGTAAGVYTIDRWVYGASLASKGTWVQGFGSRLTPLAALGFSYYLGFTSSSAYTPLAADYFGFQQRIEADNITDFAWGTSGAQPATLSFLAFSTLAGTFSGAIRNDTGTRSYPFTFNLPASAWTPISLTIPPDTVGTWALAGNNEAIRLFFDLGTGATYRGTAGAWTSADIRGVTGAVSVVAVNGAQFQFTGVKLEIGSVATPFTRKTMAERMADCQRYYQKVNASWSGNATSGGGYSAAAQLPLNPRAAATLTGTSAAANGFANAIGTLGGGGPNLTVIDTRVCTATTTGGTFTTTIMADSEL